MKAEKASIIVINFNKLWKLQKNKGMTKRLAGTGLTLYEDHSKNGKNGDVLTEVQRKIFKALNCGLEDIVEIVPE